MSYDELKSIPENKLKEWAIDWLSDWFGLIDIVIGILSLTAYYPNTQGWWFRRWRY